MSGAMIPIPYDPAQHYEQLKYWLALRDEFMTPETLPKTGFIVPGKAAGFIYLTDSPVAFMECLVGARDVPPQERNEALDAVVIALCDEARRRGCQLVLGNTQFDALVKRAERLGWDYVGGGYHVVVKRL